MEGMCGRFTASTRSMMRIRVSTTSELIWNHTGISKVMRAFRGVRDGPKVSPPRLRRAPGLPRSGNRDDGHARLGYSLSPAQDTGNFQEPGAGAPPRSSAERVG